MQVYALATVHVEVRGKLEEVSSLPPPCGAQGLNTDELGANCLYFWSYFTGPYVEFLSCKEHDLI